MLTWKFKSFYFSETELILKTFIFFISKYHNINITNRVNRIYYYYNNNGLKYNIILCRSIIYRRIIIII